MAASLVTAYCGEDDEDQRLVGERKVSWPLFTGGAFSWKGVGVSDRRDDERDRRGEEDAERRREEDERRSNELREAWRRNHPSRPEEGDEGRFGKDR